MPGCSAVGFHVYKTSILPCVLMGPSYCYHSALETMIFCSSDSRSLSWCKNMSLINQPALN